MQIEYTTRNWHTGEDITLKKGDRVFDTERHESATIDHFFKHQRYGMCIAWTNGLTIEMSWLSPRLGESFTVTRGDNCERIVDIKK